MTTLDELIQCGRDISTMEADALAASNKKQEDDNYADWAKALEQIRSGLPEAVRQYVNPFYLTSVTGFIQVRISIKIQIPNALPIVCSACAPVVYPKESPYKALPPFYCIDTPFDVGKMVCDSDGKVCEDEWNFCSYGKFRHGTIETALAFAVDNLKVVMNEAVAEGKKRGEVGIRFPSQPSAIDRLVEAIKEIAREATMQQ